MGPLNAQDEIASVREVLAPEAFGAIRAFSVSVVLTPRGKQLRPVFAL